VCNPGSDLLPFVEVMCVGSSFKTPRTRSVDVPVAIETAEAAKMRHPDRNRKKSLARMGHTSGGTIEVSRTTLNRSRQRSSYVQRWNRQNLNNVKETESRMLAGCGDIKGCQRWQEEKRMD